jgi:hypothetical protein
MPTVYVNNISQRCRQCQRRPPPIAAPIEQPLRHGLTHSAASPGVLVPQGVSCSPVALRSSPQLPQRIGCSDSSTSFAFVCMGAVRPISVPCTASL